ncbi:hypothetical protein [Paraburkholderia guartelaensis]|uniref:hypothetical protein n=1 Tax=Paraburkholderia guartelaensis TaxID=2546446 RepID=UPI002AB6D3D7|nr:hypothetical protein [Paraburkholderia guartelaensis]
MSQLGAERGRKLLVRRKQGELDSQLGRARAWATELAARGPVHPIIIGIDGMDLWLTSLRHAAFQLRAMLDVGATVVCAVDARYEDSHLLTFYLRTLGIKVIREPLLPKKLPGVSAGLKTSRLSPDAENGEPTGLFPDVQTPALSAYVAELRNPTRHMARDIQTSQRELKRRRAREGAALSALAEYERAKYERAYRNGFAVSRLRREWSL